MKKNIGEKYGLLTIIKDAPKIYTGGQFRKAFLCRCDCGNSIIRLSQNLGRCNYLNNCGCFTKSFAKTVQKTCKKNSCYRHGMYGTRFYDIYYGAKSRCNNKSLKYYGSKGIKFLWKSFIDFKKDMFISYQKHIKDFGEKQTTLDRIDSSKDYCKENCCWATYKEQAKEKRKDYKNEKA